jgi:nicotinic acid mononucleotide adenylyltransferase
MDSAGETVVDNTVYIIHNGSLSPMTIAHAWMAIEAIKEIIRKNPDTTNFKYIVIPATDLYDKGSTKLNPNGSVNEEYLSFDVRCQIADEFIGFIESKVKETIRPGATIECQVNEDVETELGYIKDPPSAPSQDEVLAALQKSKQINSDRTKNYVIMGYDNVIQMAGWWRRPWQILLYAELFPIAREGGKKTIVQISEQSIYFKTKEGDTAAGSDNHEKRDIINNNDIKKCSSDALTDIYFTKIDGSALTTEDLGSNTDVKALFKEDGRLYRYDFLKYVLDKYIPITLPLPDFSSTTLRRIIKDVTKLDESNKKDIVSTLLFLIERDPEVPGKLVDMFTKGKNLNGFTEEYNKAMNDANDANNAERIRVRDSTLSNISAQTEAIKTKYGLQDQAGGKSQNHRRKYSQRRKTRRHKRSKKNL